MWRLCGGVHQHGLWLHTATIAKMGGKNSKRSKHDVLMERSDASIRQLQVELSRKNEQLMKLQDLLNQIERKQEDAAAKAKASDGEVSTTICF